MTHRCSSELGHHWFRKWLNANPLSEPMMTWYWLYTWRQNSEKLKSNYHKFDSRKYIWKLRLLNGSHFFWCVKTRIGLLWSVLFGSCHQSIDAFDLFIMSNGGFLNWHMSYHMITACNITLKDTGEIDMPQATETITAGMVFIIPGNYCTPITVTS